MGGTLLNFQSLVKFNWEVIYWELPNELILGKNLFRDIGNYLLKHFTFSANLNLFMPVFPHLSVA